jgi:hypothetical protein
MLLFTLSQTEKRAQCSTGSGSRHVQ